MSRIYSSKRSIPPIPTEISDPRRAALRSSPAARQSSCAARPRSRSPSARLATVRCCRMYCRRVRPTPATSWHCRRRFSCPTTAAPRRCGMPATRTDWPGFKRAWRNFVGPMQNTVYADDRGTIGFIAPGLVPIRKKGDGWMPAPGWTGDYDWNGFIPFDASAECGEPARGPFRQRQQQDRPRQLSLFPQPRLGFAEPRRADQRLARPELGADPGDERRDPGRHLFVDG